MQSLPPTPHSSMQQGGVGMKGALIDAEGFPRADIDLYAVRTARNRIICEYTVCVGERGEVLIVC